VVENDQVKILWDFNIFCDHVNSARRPHLTLVDKLEKLITLVVYLFQLIKGLQRKR